MQKPAANAHAITTANGAGPARASRGSANGKTASVATKRIRRGRQRSIRKPQRMSPTDVAVKTAPHAAAPPRSSFAIPGPST